VALDWCFSRLRWIVSRASKGGEDDMAEPEIASNTLDSFPIFQNYAYTIAVEPLGSRVRAWGKLRECERRLEMYRWIEGLDQPPRAEHRILLDDMVGAFLLSFEAVLQFLRTQYRLAGAQPDFYVWLVQQPSYDVTMKGLRTIRHLEAHIKEKQTRSAMVASPPGYFERTWRLPDLSQSDLSIMRQPTPILAVDLPDWNRLVDSSDVLSVCTDGLIKLRDILYTTESMV